MDEQINTHLFIEMTAYKKKLNPVVQPPVPEEEPEDEDDGDDDDE
ncbi:hypothetical protein YQE_03202, partial [Dendroctonus ponderosae]